VNAYRARAATVEEDPPNAGDRTVKVEEASAALGPDASIAIAKDISNHLVYGAGTAAGYKLAERVR
jgi:hypothetical protein